MADEMLGIMVTKHENPEHIVGVVKAARAAGHPVTIFMTDEGVKFATNPEFLELLKVGGVEVVLITNRALGSVAFAFNAALKFFHDPSSDLIVSVL